MNRETDPASVAEWAVNHAKALDPRLEGPHSMRVQAMTHALREARMRITADEAIAAVDAHYANGPDVPLLTGDGLVAAVRRRRQASTLHAQATPQPLRDRDIHDRIWYQAQIDITREFPCDTCHAQPGQLCTNRLTGLPLADAIAGHPSRMRRALTKGTAA